MKSIHDLSQRPTHPEELQGLDGGLDLGLDVVGNDLGAGRLWGKAELQLDACALEVSNCGNTHVSGLAVSLEELAEVQLG
jgi:hypothetical protein